MANGEDDTGYAATIARVMLMDKKQMRGLQGGPDRVANVTSPVSVTVGMPDSSCEEEGRTHRVGSKIIFIESKR